MLLHAFFYFAQFKTMFSYQAIVAFLVFIVGFLFLLPYVKRGRRLVSKAGFACFNSKFISIDNKVFKARKEQIFSCLDETVCQLDRPLKVVEIGAGAGANFEFLPKFSEIVCVEPNEYAKKYLMANAKKCPEVKVEYHVGVAENMFFVATESVDVVVCTRVLCSVKEVDQTLREVLRILKKGGKFLFLEHIEADAGSSIQYWQHVFKQPWQFIAEGCTLTRRTDVLIKNAGFDKTDIEIFDENFPQLSILLKPLIKLICHHCAGVAIK